MKFGAVCGMGETCNGVVMGYCTPTRATTWSIPRYVQRPHQILYAYGLKIEVESG